jgi:hypothetical protein
MRDFMGDEAAEAGRACNNGRNIVVKMQKRVLEVVKI